MGFAVLWTSKRARWCLLVCCSVFLCSAGSEAQPCHVTISGPNPRFIKFGEEVSFNCISTCNASYDLQWETTLGKEQITKSGPNETLWAAFTSRVTDWNPKPVECVVVISASEIPRDATAIIPYQPPEDVRIGLPRLMEVGLTDDITCDVRNFAPKRFLTVLIQRGDDTLYNQSFTSDGTSSNTSVTVTHRITAQREDHGAEYTCLALLDLRPNGELIMNSSQQNVSVYDLPEDPRIEISGLIEVGSEVRARCEVSKAFPIGEVTLELEMEMEVAEFEPHLLNVTETRIHDTLTVEALVPTEYPGQGLLTCRASFDTRRKTAEKNVLIYSFSEPVLDIGEAQMEGTDVNIACTVLEAVPGNVKFVIGTDIEFKTCYQDPSLSCNYTLTTQKEHNGMAIHCNVTLEFTDMTKTTQKTLSVKYGPEFNDSLCAGEQMLVEGRNVTFTCKADGNPPPKVECSKNGSVDTWKNIGRNDSGSYLCTAYNSVSSINRTVDITVEYKPTVTLQIKPTENIEKGQNLTLTCQADGLPIPVIIWVTPEGANLIYSLDNSTVTIASATMDDSGNYACEAWNRHGLDKQEMIIHVSDRTPGIIGAVVGALVVCAVIAAGVAYYLYNRAKKIRKYELQRKEPSSSSEMKPLKH